MKCFALPVIALLALSALSACGTPSDSRNGPPGKSGNSQEGFACQLGSNPVGNNLRETVQTLALTPRQQVLWDSYQESVSKLMSDQLRPESQIIRKNAPQQINAKVDTVRNRLAAMEDIAEKASALYDALDENQKNVADRLLNNTLPTLYSGMNCQSDNPNNEKSRIPPGGRGNTGGMGGPGGGMSRY